MEAIAKKHAPRNRAAQRNQAIARLTWPEIR